jgi:DnaK suppressor protein
MRSERYGREKDPSALDPADMAVETYTKEFMFGKSTVDRATLQMIENAIERIENGNFGTCSDCEESIQPRRLNAIPWAQYCLNCQRSREKRISDN